MQSAQEGILEPVSCHHEFPGASFLAAECSSLRPTDSSWYIVDRMAFRVSPAGASDLGHHQRFVSSEINTSLLTNPLCLLPMQYARRKRILIRYLGLYAVVVSDVLDGPLT